MYCLVCLLYLRLHPVAFFILASIAFLSALSVSKTNFGMVDLHIRRWERLQRLLSLCELGLEEFPVDPLGALATSNSNSGTGSCSSGGSMLREQQQQQLLLPPVECLAYSEVFQLKCCVVLHSLEALLSSQNFLSSRFLLSFCLNDFLGKTSRRKEPPNGDRFWKRVQTHAVATESVACAAETWLPPAAAVGAAPVFAGAVADGAGPLIAVVIGASTRCYCFYLCLFCYVLPHRVAVTPFAA